jgi:hypothetical protein
MAVEWHTPVLRAWMLAAVASLGSFSCDSPAPPPRIPSGAVSFDAPPSSATGGEHRASAAQSIADPEPAPAGYDQRFIEVEEPAAAEIEDFEWDAHPAVETHFQEPAPAPIDFLGAGPQKIADESDADMSLRNLDFPNTYIESVHVDLTNPHHWVRLSWAGPEANRQETGPFRSSPGAGLGRNDCDDIDESMRNGSNCTPKGENIVEGFSDYLPSVPRCKFVTWFNYARQIAFHSHWQVPRFPASHGCVRLDRHAAQLIHNNSKAGETRVFVNGTWSRW